MRITLLIGTFSGGGADRAMAIMANRWADDGHDVTLATLARVEDDFYRVDARVRRLGLDLLRNSSSLREGLINNWRRVRGVRQAIRTSRPDIVISFVDTMNVLTLVATIGVRVPVVVCEQADPRQLGRRPWQWLRAALYHRASAVVVVAAAMAPWARRLVGAERVVVIPNPVEPPTLGESRDGSSDGQGRTLIAMGRLAHQKGFDVLLRAFAACAARHRAWSLVILGEGDQRRMLEAQRAELGLSDRVKFPGWVPEPIRLLRQADLFVMSSRYEGLPLALLEAMACGLPAISTDCPTGPSEVIRHGENGWLVPVEDVDALAAALDRLMGDGEMRRRLALRATDVTKQFGAQRIMTLWMDLIERLTRRAGRPGTPPSVPQRPAAS